ncbi:MAG: amidohydrolase family protein [Phycisphaerae bacterium]|nr:amidohydrolase family protein [Phycisphaerae bacterium]
MIIDIHCHYTFTRLRATAAERFSFEPLPEPNANRRDGIGRPSDYDSCVSPRAMGRPTWRLARWIQGYPLAGDELDRILAAEYERHLHAEGPIERFVLLAFDAVCDDAGTCPALPSRRGDFGSDIYTSNSLIREVCRRYPDRFLFGASVHPYRPDAVACVEEVFAAGACLLKWIPLHHNIAASDPRTVAVLKKCAALGLPVLVHYGEEFSLTTQRREHRSLRPLLETLRQLRREGGMPCVIVAHAATPVTPLGHRDSHRVLVEALTGEFADAPLYADISALATWTKVSFLRRLLRRSELHAKLLFGSDFPIPTGVRRLWWDLGRDYRRLRAIRSWPQRIAAVYRRLGFEEIVFHRAAELLPNVDYFLKAPGSA